MTDHTSAIKPNPPLYKQGLVGLLVGVTLGPLVGWFIGFIAIFVALSWTENPYNVAHPPARMSMFVGGLVGIVLAAIVGPLVGIPLRIIYSTFSGSMANVRIGGAAGAVMGLGAGLLIHLFWNPTPEAFIYLIIHAVFVGTCVGMLTVVAQPKWL